MGVSVLQERGGVADDPPIDFRGLKTLVFANLIKAVIHLSGPTALTSRANLRAAKDNCSKGL